ncbi:methyltransferase domain-containing protein [Endozoicomonas sp. SM1973]|uniref:Methyltransferase domain-containing protein n=1 Tax=Spartinivicinus marinus TaxID=2994442 RepID=A0A853I6E9_9GAMM|nr:class I SAM-dependent methyltransferase [Spartinivicinus marinus]MCX4030258.1 class I SAM-dependent methyltransferase [Spartinivicinus marinus]NYZ69490.1 methyltransferase domain-containing protein [Spartinivicinus marinus]
MGLENQISEFTFDTFFNNVNGYYRTAAVKAAIELGIFDIVGENRKSIDEVANECQSSRRGIRILCYFLASIGFLKVDGDVFYMTREMVMFLSRKAPGYLGDSIDFLLSPYIMSAFDDLASVIRTGEIRLSSDGVVAPDHPQWVMFARAMSSMMSLPSVLLAELVDTQPNKPIKVLDVAAGHGLFGTAVARKNPNAQVTFLDWENVLQVAKENVAKAGVEDRAQFMPGSAFDVDWGEGYDAVLLTNFLHHFDKEGCQVILEKAKAALNENGRAYVFEFIANEDRISPSLAAATSMMMLGTTPAGEVYTYSDIKEMFENVNYSNVELRPIPPAMENVVVGYKNSL